MQANVNGAILSVKIVAAVTSFPTVAAGSGLIVDLGRLQDVLGSSSLAPAQPDQWWLATAPGPASRPG